MQRTILRYGFTPAVCCIMAIAIASASPAAPSRFSTLFCPKVAVAGFERDKLMGEIAFINSDLPAETNDLRHVGVYITSHNSSLIYIQTNYKPTGFEHAVKVTSDEHVPTDKLVSYVLAEPAAMRANRRINKHDMAEVAQHLGGVRVLVDYKLLGGKLLEKYPLTGLQNVQYFGPDLRPHATVEFAEGNTRVATTRFGDGLYLRADSGPGGFEVLQKMKKTPFYGGDIRVLSLVMDEATNKLAVRSFKNRKLNFDFSSMENLKRVLSSQRGKTVFAVGHVEGADFVTRDLHNAERFRIGIERLVSLGESLGVDIRATGCKSAFVSGTGPADSFNSVDFIGLISKASSRAQTQYDFWNDLGSQRVRLVLDTHSAIYHDTSKRRVIVYIVVGGTAVVGGTVVASVVISNS